MPATLAIDPALREAGAAIARTFLDRMRPVLRGWAEEEIKQADVSAPRAVVEVQLTARIVNEVVLWQLDQVGGEHEQAWLEAARTAGVCRTVGGDDLFAQRLRWLHASSPAQRAAVLAGEAELLRRFGGTRDAVPARPPISASERAEQTLQQIRSGGARPLAAMPPILASQLFGPDDRIDALGAESRCALHQWWLHNAMRSGTPKPDEAALIFRYAMLVDASQLLTSTLSTSAEKAIAKADGYPDLARGFLVQGRVLVHITVDRDGRFRRASVAQRDLGVPGIRGIRPVAFETVFDSASMERARSVTLQKPKPESLNHNGEAVQEIEMIWRLQ